MRKANGESLAPVPGWVPLLVGGLLLHAGLVREYLGLRCFPYSGAEDWLRDLTWHANLAQAALGAAILVPATRSLAAVLLVVGSVGALGIVLYVQNFIGLDVSRIPLFGPCELSLPGHVAAYLGLLAAGAWLLAGSPAGKGTSIPVATAVPLCAAAVFVLTALLKLWATLNPPGCVPGTVDEAGRFQLDPLYPWLWWGGRLAILIESAIGVLILIPESRRKGAILGAAFVVVAASGLAVLTAVTGRNLMRMCGCFGPLELPLGAHLTFDGMLLGLLIWTHRLQRPPLAPGDGVPDMRGECP